MLTATFRNLTMGGSLNFRDVYFVLADIDYFKKINDEYGHDVGDQVLVCFAHFLKNSIHSTDQVYRFGGEEFLLIFEGYCYQSAIQRTEELIKALNEKPLKLDDLSIAVTASFGLAVLKDSDTDISVVSRADKALYQAKRSGRNRLCTME
ncbi:GGDEF domain-containing protein [Shewanella sp. GD04112]|uniref:GGDEF domain-containing protein n=1 Tax=Shewanella sp. GD04112 TaxID=2975434 RepID=UPI002446B80F|nr:GGDEF domain-containing protein [Shewanella sp. GD04112]MDH0450271.1 GGDEF domain-containing protein [Shewanella sp. GD04112]